MDSNGGGMSQQRNGRYVAYDDLRQVVRDLLAPLYERLDTLREEVAELKRRPQQEADNRRSDVTLICLVIGTLIALSTCGSGFLYLVVTIWLHYAR